MASRYSWYEDDVVVYTSDGRLPKIQALRRFCWIAANRDGSRRKYKAFPTRGSAETALRHVLSDGFGAVPPWKRDMFVAFQCPKCCLWHLMPPAAVENVESNRTMGRRL